MKTTKKISFAEARAQYVHRFTMDYVPQWALKVRDDGTYCAPQFISDLEWYEHTVFPPQNGLRKYCTTSGQTWPLGQALNSPFDVHRNRYS